MPEKFNELLLRPDIIELYNSGITPDYGYLMNGRFEKDMIKTLCPLKTLSGNPITWEASDTEYLFPVVSFEPKQAGSGDPSPENVRPISGYDEVTVNVRGKNLFDISKIENNYQITNNGDGTLTIMPGVGTTAAMTGKTLRELCNGITPGTYTINAESTGSNKIVYTQVIGAWAFGTSKTLTNEMLDSMLYLYASEEGSTATISNIQIELGSTPTPYEPYQPGTTATLTLPEVIYGGAVNAVTGVGSKTWGYIASYNGESLPGEWISDRDVYSAGTTPTTGAQVAYKLATPEPFQSTGNQALTIQPGNHTMYTDGNNISLSRKARRLEV